LLRLVCALLCSIALLASALFLRSIGLVLQLGMLWNAFLAALPLVFALLLYYRWQLRLRSPLDILLGLAWLAFFPNAPYMVTDLIHLNNYTYRGSAGGFVPSMRSWFGLGHLCLVAAIGCLCGFLSLYLLHTMIRQPGHSRSRLLNVGGWLFCAGVSMLAGIGVYIGRFLCFNTWDLLHRPSELLTVLSGLPKQNTLLMCVLLGAMTFGGYVLFYASHDSAEEHRLPVTHQAPKARNADDGLELRMEDR